MLSLVAKGRALVKMGEIEQGLELIDVLTRDADTPLSDLGHERRSSTLGVTLCGGNQLSPRRARAHIAGPLEERSANAHP